VGVSEIVEAGEAEAVEIGFCSERKVGEASGDLLLLRLLELAVRGVIEDADGVVEISLGVEFNGAVKIDAEQGGTEAEEVPRNGVDEAIAVQALFPFDQRVLLHADGELGLLEGIAEGEERVEVEESVFEAEGQRLISVGR